MSVKNLRAEVMLNLERKVSTYLKDYLIPPEKIWQPSDFLPNPQSDSFMDEVEEIREIAKDLGNDFWVTLVGDMVTEEALPTYGSACGRPKKTVTEMYSTSICTSQDG